MCIRDSDHTVHLRMCIPAHDAARVVADDFGFEAGGKIFSVLFFARWDGFLRKNVVWHKLIADLIPHHGRALAVSAILRGAVEQNTVAYH